LFVFVFANKSKINETKLLSKILKTKYNVGRLLRRRGLHQHHSFIASFSPLFKISLSFFFFIFYSLFALISFSRLSSIFSSVRMRIASFVSSLIICYFCVTPQFDAFLNFDFILKKLSIQTLKHFGRLFKVSLSIYELLCFKRK
jgi:hypothetical protein